MKKMLKLLSKEISENSILIEDSNELQIKLEDANKQSDYKNRWIKELKYCIDDPYLVVEYNKRKIKKTRKVFKELKYEADLKFGRVTYARIDCFNDETIKEVKMYLDQSKQKYLILDLRYCVGGTLISCVSLLNEFLTGEYLSVNYRNRKTIYYTKNEINYNFERIVIWVSKSTISAGEIFVYSLRAKYRENCRVIGAKTANKKYGQTTFVDDRNRLYLSYSTFTWTIPNINYSLEDLINEDNTKVEYKNIDDYYFESLKYFNISIDAKKVNT